MKLGKIMEGYRALSKICDIALPFRYAYGIKLMMSNMEPHRNIAVAEEKALVERYQISVDGNGVITTANGDRESAIGFMNAMNEIIETDVDWTYDKVQIDMNDISDISFSVREIECLSYFVDFV